MANNLLVCDAHMKDQTEESQLSSSEEDLAGVVYVGDVDESSSSTFLPEFYEGKSSNQISFAENIGSSTKEDDSGQQSLKSEHQIDTGMEDPHTVASLEISESMEDLLPEELEENTETLETDTKASPDLLNHEVTNNGEQKAESIGELLPPVEASTFIQQSEPKTSRQAEISQAIPPNEANAEAQVSDLTAVARMPYPDATIDFLTISKCETIPDVQELDPRDIALLSPDGVHDISTIPRTETTPASRESCPSAEASPLQEAKKESSTIPMSGTGLESQELDQPRNAGMYDNQLEPGESAPAKMDKVSNAENAKASDIIDRAIDPVVSEMDEIPSQDTPAVMESKQVHCAGKDCTSLLSDLSDEVGRALDMLLNDAPEKKESGNEEITSDSSRKLDTPKMSIKSRKKREAIMKPKSATRPETSSTRTEPRINKNEVSPADKTRSSGFKARPLPKYLSKGPPKLSKGTFKPTVQVPFRLRTEERFLSRHSNCVCCIEKRNMILSSRHHDDEASPTDVKTFSLETKRKLERSPVRPTKLDELFYEV